MSSFKRVTCDRPGALNMRIVIILHLLLLTTVNLTIADSTNIDETLNRTELVFVFLIYRTGDETPDRQVDLSHFGNDAAIATFKALIEPWGYETLTDAGKRTSYKTGQFIRRRYNDIIGNVYNYDNVYIRSTDYNTAKMSALTAMAAVFRPTEHRWSKDINWVPVPYTTVPAEEDFLLSFPSCQNWVSSIHTLMKAPLKMESYEKAIAKVAKKTKHHSLNNEHLLIFYFHDVIKSLMLLGYDFGDEIKEIMPNISTASARSWDFILYDNMLQFHTGVLLKEFFTHATKIIEGKSTQKVRIYSAHDINVYSLEAATKVKRQGIPKYGSVYSLELRRVVKTGKYVVVPVYLADPHEGEEIYLKVHGCGDWLCDYHKFYNLTSKYQLSEDIWLDKCKNSNDFLSNTTIT